MRIFYIEKNTNLFLFITLITICANKGRNVLYLRVGFVMARKFAKSFYNSKAWKDCQRAYKTYRMGICERCGRAEGTEVHHKIMLDEVNILNPNITLNFDNLELLCKTCHAKHHNQKHGFTRDDVMFDEFGDLIKNPETKTGKGF